MDGYGRQRRGINTLGSNVVLSTLGSIPHDVDLDIERDVVEMDDIRLGLGMELGSLSTAIGGDDGEPVADGAHGDSPAPAYHSIDNLKGQHGQRSSSNEDAGLQGIRINVERAMSLDL